MVFATNIFLETIKASTALRVSIKLEAESMALKNSLEMKVL